MVTFASETACALVAEGVETEAELATLRALGVTFGQGYLFGRPVPIEQAVRVDRPETCRSADQAASHDDRAVA